MATAFLRLSERIAEMISENPGISSNPAHIVFTGSSGELVFAGIETDMHLGHVVCHSAELRWRV